MISKVIWLNPTISTNQATGRNSTLIWHLQYFKLVDDWEFVKQFDYTCNVNKSSVSRGQCLSKCVGLL